MKDGLRIICHGSLQVIKALQVVDEGFYQCQAKLKIIGSQIEKEQNQKIFLKIEEKSNISKILAIILVSILTIFLVVGAGLKFTGHQLNWEKKSKRKEVSFGHHTPMDYRFFEAHSSPRSPRTRQPSTASAMSGIVFNVRIDIPF